MLHSRFICVCFRAATMKTLINSIESCKIESLYEWCASAWNPGHAPHQLSFRVWYLHSYLNRPIRWTTTFFFACAKIWRYNCFSRCLCGCSQNGWPFGPEDGAAEGRAAAAGAACCHALLFQLRRYQGKQINASHIYLRSNHAFLLCLIITKVSP